MNRVVVIGANHSALSAINTIIDRFSGEVEVVAFEQDDNISFIGADGLLWVSGVVNDVQETLYSSEQKLKNKGIKLHMNTKVVEIDTQNHTVTGVSSSGQKVVENWNKLILATGSEPILPRISGIQLENITTVKTLLDAYKLKNIATNSKIKSVGIIGGGYIGVETAEALRKARSDIKIQLFDTADKIMGKYYDEPFNKHVHEILERNRIELKTNEELLKITGSKKVERITTNIAKYNVDAVVFAIGFKPRASLLPELKRGSAGAYKVNRFGQTSNLDIYASGDCATVWHSVLEDDAYIALGSNATHHGILAGENAATSLTKPEVALRKANGVAGSNALCLFGEVFASTGLTHSAALSSGFNAQFIDFTSTLKPAYIKDGNAIVQIRLVYNQVNKTEHRLLGAQIYSEVDISGILSYFSLALDQKLTLEELRYVDLFFLPQVNQVYNFVQRAIAKVVR
ncbi:MAG: FAD-dependent oxidoreductase [Candidatus Ancillula sp.]|jgi:NADPH-dependent 2,4-dienoyl-CoA reductase/sulfur reductase-like enzyme|nr:FAD-dependent oxidoreductase [Candidatus Ancillula sp.]